jgi:hypothetical protein
MGDDWTSWDDETKTKQKMLNMLLKVAKKKKKLETADIQKILKIWFQEASQVEDVLKEYYIIPPGLK